jgi:hypothetical protein
MQTYAMLTRLDPNGFRSPTAVEDLEYRVMAHIRLACPTVRWLCSYAVLGPCDYLDLFEAETIEDATKISAIIRSYGHAHSEIWPLTEWSRFKSLIEQLDLKRA